MSKESQRAWVLSRLKHGDTLSSRDAVLAYGIQDLPKRVSELRKMGYPVESERVNGYGRNGTKTHWNLYRLAQR